jgi:beta-mannosidase
LLKPGTNELKVILRSPIGEGAKLREAYGIQLPHDSDPSGVSPYIRKAAYQFGWDFAPRLVTCGIWQEVELRGWSIARLGEVRAETGGKKLDQVRVYADLKTGKKGYRNATCEIWYDDTLLTSATARDALWAPIQTQLPAETIGSWGLKGHGSQPMHQLRVKLKRGEVLLSERSRSLGRRSLDWDVWPDDIGSAFTCSVNEAPIFMKGCNIIPVSSMAASGQDGLWVTKVRDMQRAGMNMVRVWAGGIYPPEAFFHACDTAGILVWQDFMLANMVPAEGEMSSNIHMEAQTQLKRFMNHASHALFCGNNELRVAWHNWGWQERYGLHGADSARVITTNEKLWSNDLLMLTSGVGRSSYTPTSPLSNWGNAEGLKNGDLHYWGVWHGDSAFSSFRNNVGRFVSEYGFQSYPDSATLATQLDPEHLYLGSPMLAARQKSYKTDKPIWTAIDREFAVKPRYLGEFILFSQLAQAEAYRQAIWAHVTGQPHCMGTLFWQLNDVWAGPSWSTVDHTGTWKAAMYEVARSYKPVVLDLELASGTVTATLWNERTDLKTARVVTQVFRTDGTRISSDTSTVMLGMGKKPLPSVGQKALLKGGGPDRHVVRVAVLDDRGEVLAERILPFKRMGEMGWEKAEVRLERLGGTQASVTYRLSTDRPVPVVKLEASGAEFSDNYFPLLPDTDRTVTVTWPGGMTGKVGLRWWP